jgi:uncharacterized membrane protein YedE/YeeE
MSDPKTTQWPLLRNLVAFSSAFIFAIGLSISGMTQPQVVLGFLNVFDWNPILLFVMASALAISIPAYRYISKTKKPFFDTKLFVPDQSTLDKPLLFGAFIFGIGWGIGGYCPGPGLVSAAAGSWEALAFVIAMTVGMISHHFFKSFTSRS